MIGFVQDTQGLDFVGAVEWLADRFRIPIEYEESSPGEDARRRGASASSRSSTTRPASTSATSGIACRELRPRLPRRARPARGGLPRVPARARSRRQDACPQGAREGLHGRGATGRRPDAAAAAGTTSSGGSSSRSPMPAAVCSVPGAPLHDDDPLQAKYVNTPESELFTKGAVVYGLDLAERAIAREDRACVVEGNTDVIALRQAGFEPVVACMGTALTEPQLKELGRLTKRLWLAFDGEPPAPRRPARDGARGQPGVRREGRGASAGHRPGRRSRGFQARLAGGAALRGAPSRRSRHAAPRTARPRAARSRPSSTGVPTRSTAAPRGTGRTTTSGCRSRSGAGGPGSRRRRRRRARRGGGQDRARRARWGDRPSELMPASPIPPSSSGSEQHRALRSHLVDGDPARRRRSRCSPSSTTGRRRRDRQGDRRGLPAPHDRARGSVEARRSRLRAGSGVQREARPDQGHDRGARRTAATAPD